MEFYAELVKLLALFLSVAEPVEANNKKELRSSRAAKYEPLRNKKNKSIFALNIYYFSFLITPNFKIDMEDATITS